MNVQTSGGAYLPSHPARLSPRRNCVSEQVEIVFLKGRVDADQALRLTAFTVREPATPASKNDMVS